MPVGSQEPESSTPPWAHGLQVYITPCLQAPRVEEKEQDPAITPQLCPCSAADSAPVSQCKQKMQLSPWISHMLIVAPGIEANLWRQSVVTPQLRELPKVVRGRNMQAIERQVHRREAGEASPSSPWPSLCSNTEEPRALQLHVHIHAFFAGISQAPPLLYHQSCSQPHAGPQRLVEETENLTLPSTC